MYWPGLTTKLLYLNAAYIIKKGCEFTCKISLTVIYKYALYFCRDWFTDSGVGKAKDLYCLQVCTYIDSLAVHALWLVLRLVNAYCSLAAAKFLIGAVEQDTCLLSLVLYPCSKLFLSSVSFLCACLLTSSFYVFQGYVELFKVARNTPCESHVALLCYNKIPIKWPWRNKFIQCT